MGLALHIPAPSSASGVTAPRVPQGVWENLVRHHRKPPAQGLARSRSSAQGSSLPGPRPGSNAPAPRGAAILGEIPHCGCFARHHSAAISALRWVCLGIWVVLGPRPRTFLFFRDRPQGCLCVHVCIRGHGHGAACLKALSMRLEPTLSSPRHPQPSAFPQMGHGQSGTQLARSDTSCRAAEHLGFWCQAGLGSNPGMGFLAV